MESLFTKPHFVWFIIGLVFFIVELVAPGLILVFFGLGAWIAALFAYIFHFGLELQVIVFMIVSLASLFIFRKNLKKKFFSEKRPGVDTLEDEFIGKIAIANVDFEKSRGKVEFKGTQWSATSELPISKGDEVEIIAKDSITLIVKPIK